MKRGTLIMKLTEETISKETIYDGRIIKLEKHQVSLPDGQTSEREVVLHLSLIHISNKLLKV